jgi:hypothetical protein
MTGQREKTECQNEGKGREGRERAGLTVAGEEGVEERQARRNVGRRGVLEAQARLLLFHRQVELEAGHRKARLRARAEKGGEVKTQGEHGASLDAASWHSL